MMIEACGRIEMKIVLKTARFFDIPRDEEWVRWTMVTIFSEHSWDEVVDLRTRAHIHVATLTFWIEFLNYLDKKWRIIFWLEFV